MPEQNRPTPVATERPTGPTNQEEFASLTDSRIFSRFSVHLFLVVVMFSVVLACAYYSLVHQRVRDQLRDLDAVESEILFSSLSSQLRRDFEAAQKELTSLAGLPAVRSFEKEGMDEALVQAEDTMTFYRKFTALDTHGRIVSRPSKEETENEDRSDRSYFTGTVQHQSLFVDEPRQYETGLSISIGVPVFARDEVFVGVLVGHVALTGVDSRLCQAILSAPARSRYRVMLLSREGRKIADSAGQPEPADLEALDCRDHPLRVLASDRGHPEEFTLGGVRYTGIAATLQPSGWLLIVQTEQAPLLARVDSIVNTFGLLFGLVFVVLLGLVILYGSRVVRPISRLTSSLVRFGKVGEAEALSDVRASGEVGEAVEAFNQMIVERKQVESELLRQRGELQALASELSRIEHRMRHEIASELHDHISQNLAASKIRLEMLQTKQSSEDRESSLHVAIDLLRECIRSTSDLTKKLAQPGLEQVGLVKALQALVAEYQQQHTVDFEFEGDAVSTGVDEEIADIVFRGVRELLHNVVKHARAKRATVRLENVDGALHLEVSDDGVGFGSVALQARKGQVGGFGLFSFSERVRQIGGRFDVSSSPGHGCRVTMVVPTKRGQSVSVTG